MSSLNENEYNEIMKELNDKNKKLLKKCSFSSSNNYYLKYKPFFSKIDQELKEEITDSIIKNIEEVDNNEKIRRVSAFIDAFQNLWSSGRQSRFLADISPKFMAGALMKAKNPIFLESVEYPVNIENIKSVKDDYSDFIEDSVFAGQKTFIENDDVVSMKDGFDSIKSWVKDYYNG